MAGAQPHVLTRRSSGHDHRDTWPEQHVHLRAARAQLPEAEGGPPSSWLHRGAGDAGRSRSSSSGACLLMQVKDYEGQVGNKGHITRRETGNIPTTAVAKLPGVKGEIPGEHRNRRGPAWDEFKHSVKTHGITEPIFITVDHNDVPRISEGNHRRDAAVELGMPSVPAEVRYFGHAEQQGSVTERHVKNHTLNQEQFS